jgi:hypothetical protein
MAPMGDPEHAAAVVAAMPVAVTRCSADLRYLWVSDRYAAWLGKRFDPNAPDSALERLGARQTRHRWRGIDSRQSGP